MSKRKSSSSKKPKAASKPPPLSAEHEQNLLTYLLLALVFLLLVVPIAESVPFASALVRVGMTAVLILAAIATRRRRSVIVLGLLIAFVAAPVSWVTMFINHPLLLVCSCILESAFFVAMAVLILYSVFQKHLATFHSIFGAISAYLLIGLAWAMLYWGLDHVDPDALTLNARRERGPEGAEVASLSQFIYFSFVTMSTLGYGDISPRSSIAQTLTWTQSVAGQFYIAAIVAWLVSEIPGRRRHQPG